MCDVGFSKKLTPRPPLFEEKRGGERIQNRSAFGVESGETKPETKNFTLF
jgi:hypothetical protein